MLPSVWYSWPFKILYTKDDPFFGNSEGNHLPKLFEKGDKTNMSIEHWALNKQEGTCSFGRFCVKDCPNFQIGVEGWSIIAIVPNYFRISPSFKNPTKLLGSPILKMDLLIGKSSAWLEPSLLEKIEDLHIYVITENDLLCFPSAHGPKPLLVHLSIVQTSFCLQMPSLTSPEMTQMSSTTCFI